MFITKKALPRRTFLRGAGATLALPLLDAMVPALSRCRRPTPRLGFIYVSERRHPEPVDAGGPGANFELSPILEPAGAGQGPRVVLSGLSHRQADTFGDGTGDHPRSTAVWLSGVHAWIGAGRGSRSGWRQRPIRSPPRNRQGHAAAVARAGARDFPTQVACDSTRLLLLNTVSWRTPTTPNPDRNASAHGVRTAVRRRRHRRRAPAPRCGRPASFSIRSSTK